MTQRFIDGLNNHNRFSRFSYDKYEKRSPIGQLQMMYNVQPSRPFISVKLPKNQKDGASSSLKSVTTQLPRKTPRGQSAPIWIKVPNHNEMLESCSLIGMPNSRRVVFTRPHTVTTDFTALELKKGFRTKSKSAGKFSSNNSTLYQFKSSNVEPTYNKKNISLCTALIKEQWDSRKRQYIRTGIYARGKSEAKDQELLQWFTFEGDSPGALSAFTKGDAPDTSSKFSIEASVGKEVASKLLLGGTVRIGSNGKLLESTQTELNETDEFYVRCKEVLSMTRLAAAKHEPLYPPLCWKDVEKEAKILTSRTQNGSVNDQQTCRTEPVVFNQTPQIKPYVSLQSQPDVNRLNTLLAKKVPNKLLENEPCMTYEEVLESCIPEMNRNEKVSGHLVRQPMPSRESTEVGHGQSSLVASRRSKSSHQPSSSILVNKSLSARVRTPSIPDEIKRGMQRQVTMPAYKIVVAPETIEKVNGRQKMSYDVFHERIATPSRPPKYIPVYNAGGRTTPSISHNGVVGDKSFVQISKPFHQFGAQDSFPSYLSHSRMESEQKNRGPALQPEHLKRPHNTPANISSATLVGKAPPFKDVQKSLSKHQQDCDSQALETDESSLTEATKLGNPPIFSVVNEPVVNRMAISIPAVDMVSASSVAGNSLADFHEFDGTVQKAEKCMSNNRFSLDQTNERAPSIDSFNDQDSIDFGISVDVSGYKSEGNFQGSS